MRKVLLAALIVLFGVSPALAQSGSTYDGHTGNFYQWNRGTGGSTDIDGSNPGTGRQWRNRFHPNGDMDGRDGRGNYWQYNRGTGNYWNTNGKMCFGRGLGRICN